MSLLTRRRRPLMASRATRQRSVVATVLLAVITLLLSTAAPSVAEEPDWWTPTDRPAPDSAIGVTGAPFTGTDAEGQVRGFVDAHNHIMSNEGFGGRLLCGKPFSDGGITDALKDCPEHYPDGSLALFDFLTNGGDGQHDPDGWPTFADWPAHDSQTHQQNYYAWIERAWRGGQRVMVNHLVTNGVICSVYFFKDRSCDEMTSIRLQAAKTYEMQDYIDQMYGGAGQGWFRVVTDSDQAREVIAQGKLAVVLGVETSEPFGCKQILDIAQCDEEDIDRGLDELHDLGVRSVFLCHKFDNALCGVRFDTGTTGIAVNAGQFLSTGTFWTTEECRGPQQDNPIASVGDLPGLGDLLPSDVEMPSYSSDARCNVRGLTNLGEYALRGLMDRNMMVEIDHMSVKATGRALDIFESVSYPGVVSSHSWMDLLWSERVYRLGGFITQYMHGAERFIADADRTKELRDSYDVGYGFGTDMNGFGSWPGPRGADTPNPVEYPYQSAHGGAVMDRQTTGDRTWDINADGAAHYGLVPDWVEEIRVLGGQEVVDDLLRGAESYLGTWGATEGHAPGVNLATGSSASASSTAWYPFTTYAPRRAVDGDPTTRWASWWSDDQWLRLDLGSAQQVRRVTLEWAGEYAKAYRIEVSADGSSWQTVASISDGDGGLDTAFFDPTSVRYVRVQGQERGTDWGYSLKEVGVHAS